MLAEALRCSFVGASESVAAGLRGFLALHRPDELMVHVMVYEQAARRRSLTLTAALRERLYPGQIQERNGSLLHMPA